MNADGGGARRLTTRARHRRHAHLVAGRQADRLRLRPGRHAPALRHERRRNPGPAHHLPGQLQPDARAGARAATPSPSPPATSGRCSTSSRSRPTPGSSAASPRTRGAPTRSRPSRPTGGCWSSAPTATAPASWWSPIPRATSRPVILTANGADLRRSGLGPAGPVIPRPSSDRFATIDVGTNTVLLLVAERRGEGLFAVLERAEITRLGRGVDATGRLDPAAIGDTVAVLAGYAARGARAGGARRSPAWPPARPATPRNGAEFFAAARDAAGLVPRGDLRRRGGPARLPDRLEGLRRRRPAAGRARRGGRLDRVHRGRGPGAAGAA